jgi:thiol-disulfide isomerase/thioredoxin
MPQADTLDAMGCCTGRWWGIGLAAALAFGAGRAPARADVAQLVGRPAPEVRARPLRSDEPAGLEQHRGRVVLLAFVATWCGACRRVAPELEALDRAHPDLTVLALSHEARDRLRAHATREARTYPTLQCTGATARRYRATALPTLVLIGRDGTVRAAYQGASPEVMHRLRRDVAALLR